MMQLLFTVVTVKVATRSVLYDMRRKAETALRKAAADMKKAYNRQRPPSPAYKISDPVWLEATHIKSDRPTKKLDGKRYGPFTILKIGRAHV